LDVHVWTNRPIWPQSAQYTKRPSEKFSIPNGLNWDAFLGPAEDRSYHPLYQPYNWRGWRSFGTGALGDSGIHLFNLPVLGCGLQKPEKVECLLRGPVNSETYPSWAIVKYEFPGQDKGQTIPMHWYEGKIGHLSNTVTGGKNFPNLELFQGREPSASGCLIRGSKGTLYSPSIYGSKWEVYLENKWMKPHQINSFSGILGRNGRGDSGLKDELVRAIRRGEPKSTLAGFDFGYEITELILLGNIAILAGGGFSWDPELGASNRNDVNNLLTKSYRKGWEVQPA
jgi:predicted dehydrogenase